LSGRGTALPLVEIYDLIEPERHGLMEERLQELAKEVEALNRPRRGNPRMREGFRRLRGKDSNLDYLIQSQASYH
jgi:hypothetical protein